MTSPLENLVGSGSLRREPINEREYEGLVASGTARLDDAKNPDLQIESRFDLSYNAAHALCLAALRRAGYRSNSRYTVFQTLPHTLGLGPDVWRVLERAHRLRNDAEYEGYLDVEESFVRDLIGAAEAVKKALTS